MRWLPLLLVVLASSASARMPGYTVTEVWKNHVALDGKVIRVSGVVGRCRGLDCTLLENHSKEARRLGIGRSEDFDRTIQSRLGQIVVIEAKFDATCLHAAADMAFGDHGKSDTVICLDRAPVLSNPRIVSSR
nr:hypothetical protein [uncultured Sphingomonas sp.]